jgi:hypothetical protein
MCSGVRIRVARCRTAIDVAHGVGHRGGIEEVELLMAGHRELMACGLRERPKRAAEHAGPPGDQKPLR